MKHKNPFMGLLIVIVIFAFGCNEPAKSTDNTVPVDTQSVAVTPEQPAPPDKKLLVGDWTRTDAPYQIKILELYDNGTLRSGYFNPKSIHVAKATWKTADGNLAIYIELRDENYPGSNYNLTFIPGKDLLAGKYYQAVERVTYDVEFTRAK
jgi:hypothetical protein